MPRFDLARGVLLAAGAVTAAASLSAQNGDPRLTADTMKSFAFRSVGPSLTTGRISDVAVDPKNPSVWYVAAAAGNRWKTDNRGNTWTPRLRRAGLLLARRGHGRSEGLEHRLAGHR
jgi:hypothetical protein